MLANVVTIREINPFAQGGSMRVQDLTFLFKGRAKATQDYILVLLSKFELAIPYDGTHLLIPSLLPTMDQVVHLILRCLMSCAFLIVAEAITSDF